MTDDKKDPVFHLWGGKNTERAVSEKPVMWEKLAHDYPSLYNGYRRECRSSRFNTRLRNI